MSAWTHALCVTCWNAVAPERVPHRVLVDGRLEICCRCGDATTSGIYYRAAPNTMQFCVHQEDGA